MARGRLDLQKREKMCFIWSKLLCSWLCQQSACQWVNIKARLSRWPQSLVDQARFVQLLRCVSNYVCVLCNGCFAHTRPLLVWQFIQFYGNDHIFPAYSRTLQSVILSQSTLFYSSHPSSSIALVNCLTFKISHILILNLKSMSESEMWLLFIILFTSYTFKRPLLFSSITG